MWSDQTSPAHLRELVAALHSVLPPPSPTALDTTQKLRGSASPDQLAERLRLEPGFVWLDGGSTKHSLFHQPLVTVSCRGNSAVVSGHGKTVQVAARGIDILDAMLQAWKGPANARLVGFAAYDLANEIEQLDSPSIENDFNFPTLHFGLFDSFFEFDQNIWTLSGTDAWKEYRGRPISIDQAETLIREAQSISVSTEIPGESLRTSLTEGPLLSRPDRAFFEAAVARIVHRIHNGDFFQTNLCRRLEAPLEKEKVWELYRRMRSISPAQYGAFLNIGDGQAVLSLSPELFLEVLSTLDEATPEDRRVESRPIKGTRPRGVTAQDDRALSTELIASEKDRAELAMIVDVVRNDLSRVCEIGSVKVMRHAELMTLPTVHHTVSTISGRLRPSATICDLFRATFPAASITGAPKIEAMRAAMHEEGQRRGPCMGSIGWISLDGRMELSVAIRTAFATEGRVCYYTGCGITADSIPHSEFEESRHKALAFVRALGLEHVTRW